MSADWPTAALEEVRRLEALVEQLQQDLSEANAEIAQHHELIAYLAEHHKRVQEWL